MFVPSIKKLSAKQRLRDVCYLERTTNMDDASGQFTIRKKMAAVNFTTIPCETSIANRHVDKPDFWARFAPVLTTLCMLGLKVLELFVRFYERF